MRAYCDFYAVDPPDAALLALSRAKPVYVRAGAVRAQWIDYSIAT